MKKEDAAFASKFSLCATRNDFVHALVAYFDVDFNDCHRPVSFSTGPRSRATHWKQTIFYLKDTICMNAGEVIEGWDIGLIGMQTEGKRVLVVPPEFAYGNTAVGPIPANATLVFAIELISVE